MNAYDEPIKFRPRVLKVRVPRRQRPVNKILRRERIHARMLKGAA